MLVGVFFLLLVGSSVLLVWLVVLVYCCWFVALLLLVIGWGLFPERWDSPCPTNKVSVSHNNSNNFFFDFFNFRFFSWFWIEEKTSNKPTSNKNSEFRFLAFLRVTVSEQKFGFYRLRMCQSPLPSTPAPSDLAI